MDNIPERPRRERRAEGALLKRKRCLEAPGAVATDFLQRLCLESVENFGLRVQNDQAPPRVLLVDEDAAAGRRWWTPSSA